MSEQTPKPPTSPLLPQSNALAEATTDSLDVLMSRDPEGYSRQDLDKVVAAMREQRERLAKSAAEGPKPRAKAPGVAVSLKTAVGVGDLDL